MYFVRNNEEIHLPFKNSEKQRAQALINHMKSETRNKIPRAQLDVCSKVEEERPPAKKLNLMTLLIYGFWREH